MSQRHRLFVADPTSSLRGDTLVTTASPNRGGPLSFPSRRTPVAAASPNRGGSGIFPSPQHPCHSGIACSWRTQLRPFTLVTTASPNLVIHPRPSQSAHRRLVIHPALRLLAATVRATSHCCLVHPRLVFARLHPLLRPPFGIRARVPWRNPRRHGATFASPPSRFALGVSFLPVLILTTKLCRETTVSITPP